jgi:hypothetical protein
MMMGNSMSIMPVCIMLMPKPVPMPVIVTGRSCTCTQGKYPCKKTYNYYIFHIQTLPCHLNQGHISSPFSTHAHIVYGRVHLILIASMQDSSPVNTNKDGTAWLRHTLNQATFAFHAQRRYQNCFAYRAVEIESVKSSPAMQPIVCVYTGLLKL